MLSKLVIIFVVFFGGADNAAVDQSTNADKPIVQTTGNGGGCPGGICVTGD